VAWTPDSRYIVFTGFSEESGDIDLILLSRDGTYREELTHDSDFEICPAVSPLGRELVYVKTPDLDEGPFQVRRLKLKTPAHAGL
jgi:Tol biopolymer transport system component